ncbi:MAG: hypothetical protein DDT40_01561 [candidate division WS2 bacterium]|nr:hypothetical protein [Candidatus Psychracetigena formicireducens]
MAQAMPLVEAWSPPPDWKVLDVERWFEVKVPGPKRTLRSVRLVGRMDLVIEDSQGLRWIVDHKTSRRQPNMDYVRDIDEQLLLYYAAARRMGEEIEGVIWNALIVPGIEQRKAETAQEYRIRCAEVLAADPLKHFVRVPVRYNNSQVGKAWDRVGYVVQEIRRGRIYRNPEACRYWGCPFMEVCLDERHALMLGFRPKADVSGGSEGGNE